MKWNTDNIISLVKSVRPDVEYEVYEKGGDYDTKTVSFYFDEDDKYVHRVLVKGFSIGGLIYNGDDTDNVDMVEVQDGLDSRGGIHTDNPEVIQLYADILKVLRGNDYEVVDSMDRYF